jgi:2,5-dichloro-2,5-cyclohexadiene-1,4-diol dehydrogenase 1
MSAMKSKVFIVTGALGGIGRSTARLLAQAGANLVLTDLSDQGGAAFAEELSAVGSKATFFAADVGEEAEVRAMVNHAVSTFGQLDGGFNNAGIDDNRKPITELTAEEWSRTMRINAQGTFHCIKHQFRAMKSGGSIVNTSSGLGIVAAANCADYTASKHAVCGLTRAAAVEGAPLGIRVNAVLPGIVRTPMQERQHEDIFNPEVMERVRSIHLIGRYCEPEEVGYLARWLLSDEASFVTGALYSVDGGATASV